MQARCNFRLNYGLRFLVLCALANPALYGKFVVNPADFGMVRVNNSSPGSTEGVVSHFYPNELSDMQSLLIIDMQLAWINESPRYEIAAVIERINQLAGHFRQQGLPVIFVRHCEATIQQGHSEWEIHPDLVQAGSDLYVDKTACDPFWQTSLHRLLLQSGSTSVTVCGMATEFCIDTAVRLLASAAFQVQVVSDAHTTGERPHLSARQIIEHHNWVWQHMACPANVGIAIRSSAEICQQD